MMETGGKMEELGGGEALRRALRPAVTWDGPAGGDSYQAAEASKAPEGPAGFTVPPAPEEILRYFAYEHLPEALGKVSAGFAVLAQWVVANLPRCPERTVALRKLLEAKDAAVRAAL